MEKEFVPYELAVKLKALGFNEPCFSFYMGGFEELGRIKYVNPSNVAETNFLAPTFSQAFRFFRKKYPDLDFAVGKIHNGTNNYHYHINLQWEFFEGTYEEAELACLNKLITLIK